MCRRVLIIFVIVKIILANAEFQNNGEGLIDTRYRRKNVSSCLEELSVCYGTDDVLNTSYSTPQSINSTAKCGVRIKYGIGFRIASVEGEADYAEFPWLVALLGIIQHGENSLNVYRCAGSLIHPQVILTAAHCVANSNAALLKVRAGEWDTQTQNELFSHQDRDVKRIVIHPNFHETALFNDVALVFVREPFELEEHIKTLCLPPANFKYDGKENCLASGWGKDVFGKDGRYQTIPKSAELPYISSEQCEGLLKQTRLGQEFHLDSSFVCAGGGTGVDMCEGDAGAALICPIGESEPDRYYQMGIVSWGIGCRENNVPGVYTNVALFRDWIDNEMLIRNFSSSSYVSE